MSRELPQHRFILASCAQTLHPGWEREIIDVADQESSELTFDGSLSTSLHKQADVIVTRVVRGDVVKSRLPWLYDLYSNDFRLLAERSIGRSLLPSSDVISAVNINVVLANQGGYERHVDSNHVTGLLFVSDTTNHGEGDLTFDFSGHLLSIGATPGLLMFFPARDLPHYVKNRDKSGRRITVVMNYYDADLGFDRPDDLNEGMYRA